jgi:peroxiredoxin
MMVSGTPARYNIEKDVDSQAFFSNKKVILVGFPGAYTPTCTNNHLPGFVKNYSNFKNKGYEVVGLSMNDPFVLKEFGEDLEASFPFICDGSGNFTRAIEAQGDFSSNFLGVRTRRFAAVVENGVFIVVNDEKGGALTVVSQAETILGVLD